MVQCARYARKPRKAKLAQSIIVVVVVLQRKLITVSTPRRHPPNPIPLYGVGFTDGRREGGIEEYAEDANTGEEGPVMGGVWLK